MTDAEVLLEFQRRQKHAINEYQPSNEEGHNQTDYHKSRSKIRLLFGGNQSGKSHAAAFDCAINARGRNLYTDVNISGRDVEIWIIAPEYSLITNGIYRHLKNIIPDWDLISEGPRVPGHRLPTHMWVKRKDGYKTLIQFLSAKGEQRAKFQAAAVDYFYIDEEIPFDIWEELEARTLATSGTFSISATLVESYDWIMELEMMAERDDPHVFLTRLNTELNPYLKKDAVEYLKSKWSQETLEYRFYGRARRLTGLIYGAWVDTKHIIKSFDIPYDWPKWCAIDPGIRTCAVLWIAVGPDDRAYGYRELYLHNEPLWQVARKIKESEGFKLNQDLSVAFKHYVWEIDESIGVSKTHQPEEIITRLIDPKSRSRSEAGEESIISQLYSRFGLVCTPADNAVRPGLEDCRFWLEPIGSGPTGSEPIDSGIVFFDTLVNFFDERRSYRPRPVTATRRGQNEPIEDPIRRKNHLMDCWRYIAREHPKWQDRDQMESYYEKMTPRQKLEERMEEQESLF